MKKLQIYILCIALAAICSIKLSAQVVSTVDSLNKTYLNWYNMDPKLNKVEGVSIDKAYNVLLKSKTAKKKIIVAVIDGGVDTAHIDLKGKIWKNTNEIPGNNKDDDNNGYIDDVYGWNFIGNSKGENIITENYEYIRILKKLYPLFKNIKSTDAVPTEQQNDYKLYLSCKTKYDAELAKYTEEKNNIEKSEKKLNEAENTIKEYLKKDNFTQQEVEKISSTNEEISKSQKNLLVLYKKGITLKSIAAMKKRTSLYLEKYLNLEYNPRDIVGDDPENITDTKYGNNNVKGPQSEHGTLVAGIIAADRNNNIGINGIAEDVQIMALRVVPDGDERDKDVALAIRYAVDNGANIINMSFGKAFSPQKKFVDDAIKYAGDHNVLLIHAAGNDGMNNDSIEHYPSKKINDGTYAKTMINVGTSNLKPDNDYAAYFSNYGQSIDLFAPGVNIISLYPENKYAKANGTSFSCPVVSGVAALVWSYYPEITALQLKNVLLNSVTSHAKMKVKNPAKNSSTKTEISFSKLCKTGGSINAYKALKAAAKLTKHKK